MATPRTYSVRFAHGRGLNVVAEYQVPPGKRAVVKWFGAVCFTAVPAGLFLFVNGIVAIYFEAPAPNRSTFEEVRLVAYAGDVLAIQTHGPDTSFHLSGYLFDDASGKEEGLVEIGAHTPAVPPALE